MKYLVAVLLAVLMGCSSTARTIEGDSYSTSVLNDGMPTWSRTVGNEKWCEWRFPNIKHSPWLVVAYDLSDWNAWVLPVTIECETSISIDSKDSSINIDGTTYQRPVEPKAKWVRYDIGAAWRRY